MSNASIEELIRQGVAFYQAGEHVREVEIWKQVATLEPENPHWHANLAQAFAMTENFVQAEILFEFAMSFPRPPSAAVNNYVAMLANQGASVTDMLPLLVVALETSETYEHFQRHLLNVCAAIGLADSVANAPPWSIVRERSLAFLVRHKDADAEHVQFVEQCVDRFARYGAFRSALASQDWPAAVRALDEIEREFGAWAHGTKEVQRIAYFRPLVSAAVKIFGILGTVDSEADFSPAQLHARMSEAHAELSALARFVGVLGSSSFIDLLGWFCAEVIRQTRWFLSPGEAYDASAHSVPNAVLAELAETAYAELAEMLQGVLLAFNRAVRRAAERYSVVRSDEERADVISSTWRSMRAATHGFVSEYAGLSDVIGREMLGWNTSPFDRLRKDLARFKSFVESRGHSDFYVSGKPQEQIGRLVLLAFLRDLGFKEVPVRGGRVDVLTIQRDKVFVVETKIWRGAQYHDDGILELTEYIAGDAIPKFGGACYVVFDATKGGAATEHVKAAGAIPGIDVVVVNIRPPTPSKKGAVKRSSQR